MIKGRFFIQSSNLKLLSLYVIYLRFILNKLNVKYTTIFNPTTQKRITLLKSPHVYKKHKEQFLIKKYAVSFFISVHKLNKIQLFLFLQNKPKFIDLSFFLER
jgi:ribosomal protein S10